MIQAGLLPPSEPELTHPNMSDTEIELKRGDVFESSGQVFQITAVGQYDEVEVTNPLIDHPQHADAGTWKVNKDLLKEDIRNGDVERTKLSTE